MQNKNLQVKLEAEIVPERTMYLKQHLGNGSLGDIKFDASFTLPTYGLMVEVEGQRYLVPSQSIISAIIDAHIASKKS